MKKKIKILRGIIMMIVMIISSSYTSSTNDIPTYKTELQYLSQHLNVDVDNKYTLISFWHAGFPYSRINNHNIKQVYKEYKDKSFAFDANGLNLLYISIDEFNSPRKKAIKTDEIGDYPNLWDKDKSISYAFESHSPEFILLNSNGYICIRTRDINDIREKLKYFSKEEFLN